jgi:murein L,D-transpeptidase YcbB/YkuD
MRTGLLNTKNLLILLIGLCFLATSCKNRRGNFRNPANLFVETRFDEEEFAEALSGAIQDKVPNDSTKKKVADYSASDLAYITYRDANYLPLWIAENGDTKNAEAFIEELKRLSEDGIDPNRYNVSNLQAQLESIKKNKTPDFNALAAFDTLFTRTYIQAASDLTFGLVSPKKADSLWYHSNDTVFTPNKTIIATLHTQSKYPSLAENFRSKMPAYALLIKAKPHYRELAQNANFVNAKAALANNPHPADSVLQYVIATEVPSAKNYTPDSMAADTAARGSRNMIAGYQHYYGLSTTGKLDKPTLEMLQRTPQQVMGVIDANLERLRWMPREMESTHILVNVPMMELFLRNNGQEIMHMNVVVGKLARQTPSLNANMEHVVINPPWGVPPTILKQDVLPGMQRSGSAYLAKKDLKVYDLKGRQVDPSVVNASNYKQYVFRQPPGDDNALGYIKFNMPNKWNIYLHDTPHREDFVKEQRAKSSGCVRVQQPREMAEYILSTLNNKGYDQSKLQSVINTQKTKYENLSNKIPVHIVYLTAFEDNGGQQVRFVKDIYGKDNKLITILQQSMAKA